MLKQFQAIFDEYKLILKDTMPIVSGDTYDSIQADITETSLTVTGRAFIGTIEEGRRPGGRPPISVIQAWIDAKGLDLNAFAVATSIAKKGTLLFQNKDPRYSNPSGVLLDPIPNLIDKLEVDIFKEIETELLKLRAA